MKRSVVKLSALILALGFTSAIFPASALEKYIYEIKSNTAYNFTKTEFDEDGNMILELDLNSNIGLVSNEYGTHFYDVAGQLVKSSWINIKGKWYYFDEKGFMTIGWLFKDNKWYYLGEDGVMKASQWVNINGKWYYFNDSGVMEVNTVIHGYKINSSGARE